MNEGLALDWLDRLLDLDDADRAEPLRRLLRDDPPLHARLVRMLAAAEVNDGSRELAIPVLDGLRAAHSAAAFTLEPGQTLEGYRLLRELGRGGMAAVWLAERVDGAIKREVALKLPLFALTSPSDIERFAREKDVLAALTHPNIARLYDVGVTRFGQAFIVLEYVDGSPITTYCDDHRLTLEDRLRLFLQVIAAVDHAHKHLVVHRDLKPSNILVNSGGEVKLVDFGIAKLLRDPNSDLGLQLTLHGNALFTPLYAAPEQVRGRVISTHTDVYVLGVVLHEILTGVLPHAGPGQTPSLAEVVERVMQAARPERRFGSGHGRGDPGCTERPSPLVGRGQPPAICSSSERAPCRHHRQRRLPARSRFDAIPHRHVHPHRVRQGRDRAVAYARRRVSSRGVAVVQRLRERPARRDRPGVLLGRGRPPLSNAWTSAGTADEQLGAHAFAFQEMVIYDLKMDISVTEFKAHCLDLIRQVEDSGKAITIRRRGKVVARLEPASSGSGPGKPWEELRALGGHTQVKANESAWADEDFEALR